MKTKRLLIPPEIYRAVQEGYVFVLSISGGKDSDTMMREVVKWLRSIGATNEVFAIHADLGEIEWKESLPHCQALCDHLNIPLVTVKPTIDGQEVGLVDLWKRRRQKLEGQNKPFWSSARNRYCTSDGKVAPINRYLRARYDKIVSVEGIRWQESKARAEKPRVSKRDSLATRKRQALTWNAIIDWTTEDVWASGGQSGESLAQARKHYKETGKVPSWWNFHPAYAMGNARVSCALCVLGCNGDFRNGIRHHPELADKLSAMEQESRFTMRQGTSIERMRKEMEMVSPQTTMFAA